MHARAGLELAIPVAAHAYRFGDLFLLDAPSPPMGRRPPHPSVEASGGTLRPSSFRKAAKLVCSWAVIDTQPPIGKLFMRLLKRLVSSFGTIRPKLIAKIMPAAVIPSASVPPISCSVGGEPLARSRKPLPILKR